MTEPKRWQGVWVDEFEGSRFCPGERFDCPYRGPFKNTWFSPALNVLDDGKDAGDGRRYLVDFVGRRTLYAGGYGHMGMFGHEMIMDRIISIKALDGPKEKLAAKK